MLVRYFFVLINKEGMGLFDFFKKKETESTYDVSNITVLDLQVGFIFEYDLSTWEVQEASQYDWGDDYFTSEYKISDGNRVLFLSVEDDDELFLSLTEKVKVRMLGEDIPEYIAKNEKAPSKITYNGKDYFLESENPGYFNELGSEEWAELISWDYEDKAGEDILCIERWGDFEFEAAVGKNIEEYEISNILPNKN